MTHNFTPDFRCIAGCSTDTYPLTQSIYECPRCGSLLEVAQPNSLLQKRSADGWKKLFTERSALVPGAYGSGVWRYHEWILPHVPLEHLVTLGEGNTPLVDAPRLSEHLGVRLLVKQCGQSLTGSFKDLGMTVLISQVNHLRKTGAHIPAVACASTGDTSAALAAYGAAAGIPTLVLLPRGKITAAQMVQPLSNGAKVIAIETDFDGCMVHVQKLAAEGVYLANSKNSLRIEGQKTVAFEIAQGLGFDVPDWVAIPGGNLGNVSALYRGFAMLKAAGLIKRVPRLLCAQASAADPLYHAYQAGAHFTPLKPVTAQATQASAIRIGNPVSFPKAIQALAASNGVVESISEAELTMAARDADTRGLFVCPHTAVALAAVAKQRDAGTIKAGETVVVVATAHGLKFTEFKTATASDTVPGVSLKQVMEPMVVANNYDAVRKAAFG